MTVIVATYSGNGNTDISNLDPYFEEAAHAIVLSQQGSTSMIQRRFSIGYNRAGRLMDQLEHVGIVGSAQGSKPREVLIQDENQLKYTPPSTYEVNRLFKLDLNVSKVR
jgi:DNA segregation ATPase FtsK/SpoIIIE-like protein